MSSKIFAHHARVLPAAVWADATIDHLLQMLDACGIEEAVCFAPFATQLDGRGIDHNEWLAAELKTRPRLHGFGTIDVREPDTAGQVRQIHELGMRGIKLHPAFQEFDVLGPIAFEIYEAAQELNLFLSFHTGIHHYRMKHNDVAGYDEIAWHFPTLRFSMEHVGGYSFFPEALAVIGNNSHRAGGGTVYAGLTSVFTLGHNRPWYLPPERLREVVAQAGSHHCLFGLDFPYNRETDTKTGLKILRDLDLPDADLANILGGTLRTILGL
jgi:predicted TIM-barrel fold metal-dependent hydrolase